MSEAPTAYTPTTAFNSFNPSSFPNHGRDTDNEFENISTSLTETQSRLAEIQRADGALANDSVGPDQLQNSVFAGINTPDTWVTATDYVERDSVVFIVTGPTGYTKWYRCLVAHTSDVFATDLAAGYWELVLQADPGPTGPAGAGSPSTGASGDVVASGAAAGVSTNFAREDHNHNHGNLAGGALHAAATTSTAGFATLATAAQGAALSSTTASATPASLAWLLQLLGKRTSTGTGGAMTAFTRNRITASVTMTLPTFAADEWLIVERDTTAGSVTIGRNSQTIDGASTDFVMDVNKDIILFYCDSAGVVVTRYLGVVPT